MLLQSQGEFAIRILLRKIRRRDAIEDQDHHVHNDDLRGGQSRGHACFGGRHGGGGNQRARARCTPRASRGARTGVLVRVGTGLAADASHGRAGGDTGGVDVLDVRGRTARCTGRTWRKETNNPNVTCEGIIVVRAYYRWIVGVVECGAGD